MEELNKTQIILLTLLVSFVTSIATGIVTVTLMDQAPPGITQTINRVVERTIEIIVPEKIQGAAVAQTIIIKEEDFIVDAMEKNTSNIVNVSVVVGGEVVSVATGFVVSSDGLIAVDSSLIEGEIHLGIKTHSGVFIPAEVIKIKHPRIAFLEMVIDEEKEDAPRLLFKTPLFADNTLTRIGQTAIALGLDGEPILLVGVVSHLDMITDEEDNQMLYKIYATINADSYYSGGPLLNTKGELLGISIATESEKYFAVPGEEILTLIEMYQKEKEGKEHMDQDIE